MKTRKKPTKRIGRLAPRKPARSLSSFKEHISKLAKANGFNAKQKPEDRPCVWKGKKTYGYNHWEKPKATKATKKVLPKVEPKVHIINARSKHPVWVFDDLAKQKLVEVDPAKGGFRVRVTTVDGQLELLLPFKAFRALNHWGMPQAAAK